MTTQRLDPHLRRAQILEAARQLVLSRGLKATSMNDIIAASGLSKGGVYWHFKSKTEILNALLDQLMTRDLSQQAALAAESQRPAVDRIKGMAHQSALELTQWQAEIPLLIEIYVQALRDGETRQQVARVHAAQHQLITQVLSEGIASGELRPADPQPLAARLLALFEGELLLWALLGFAEPLEKRISHAVEVWLTGVKRHDPI